MSDPTDYMKIDDLQFIVGIPIQPVISTAKEITETLRELYEDNEILENALTELEIADPTESIEIILDDDDEESGQDPHTTFDASQ